MTMPLEGDVTPRPGPWLRTSGGDGPPVRLYIGSPRSGLERFFGEIGSNGPSRAARARWSRSEGSPSLAPMSFSEYEGLLPWFVLALGAAMVVGNLAAVVRPPERPREEGELERAPLARSLTFVAIGAVASLWAIGSLLLG
jgi:hypothetical protein